MTPGYWVIFFSGRFEGTFSSLKMSPLRNSEMLIILTLNNGNLKQHLLFEQNRVFLFHRSIILEPLLVDESLIPFYKLFPSININFATFSVGVNNPQFNYLAFYSINTKNGITSNKRNPFRHRILLETTLALTVFLCKLKLKKEKKIIKYGKWNDVERGVIA